MSIEHILEPIRRLAAHAGSDIQLVQGAGGNISVKHDGVLWIKGSGVWMNKALQKNIFVPVTMDEIMRRVESKDMNFAPDPGSGLKPSIETPLHALLPHRVVLHVHMLNAIICSAQADAEEVLSARLAGLNWAIAPYARPGAPLSQALQESIAGRPSVPDIVVLKNHGLIIGAEDDAALLRLLNECTARLELPPRYQLFPDYRQLVACNDLEWTIPLSPLPHSVGTDENSLRLALAGPLYPDHVVFLGAAPLVVEPGKLLSEARELFVARYECEPPMAIIPGAGVLVAPSVSDGAMAMLEAMVHVGLQVPEGATLDTLGRDDVLALLDWDAEKWRQKMDLA